MVGRMNAARERARFRRGLPARSLASVVAGTSLAVACADSPPPPVESPAPRPAASAELPPDSADDWLRRGEALVRLGETGNHDAFVQAREVLERCVARQPGSATCQYLLGEACEYTDDEACAAQAYTAAIVQAPATADYYAPLAETYLRFKLYPQAEQVLYEGIRRVPRELENAPAILGLFRLLAASAQRRGDEQARVDALEAGAREIGSDPELDFELGAAYANLTPPRTSDAARTLRRFQQRACHDEPLPRYKEPCERAATLLAALGDVPADEPPTPAPAPRAVTEAVTTPVRLPAVPAFPERPRVDGDAFTVWGASYALRSRAHRREVMPEGPERFISVTGYVTKTNLPDAPKCAVHRPGRADPPGCPRPLPTFWLGDSKDAPPSECIRVVGWASNYAQIFEAIRAFDRHVPNQYIDGFWGISVPNPLPAAGEKVTVRGTYDTAFALAGVSRELDTEMGFLTYQSQKVLEPAAELGTLPGVTRKTAVSH
jgi:tetratricopeptide (TPR) repeat protein